MNQVATEPAAPREKRLPVSLPRVPYLPSSHALDHAIAIRRDVLTLMTRCAEAGPIVRLRVPVIDAHVVTHPDGHQLSELLARTASGALPARVHSVMPLDEVADAHRAMAKGGVRGRYVLTP